MQMVTEALARRSQTKRNRKNCVTFHEAS